VTVGDVAEVSETHGATIFWIDGEDGGSMNPRNVDNIA
jgi:hypothetical protein